MRAYFFQEFWVCERFPHIYLNISSNKLTVDCQLLIKNSFQGHDILITKKKKYSLVPLLLLHSEECSRQDHFRAQDKAIKEKEKNKHIKFLIQLLMSKHPFTGFQPVSKKKKKKAVCPQPEVLFTSSSQNYNQHSVCENQPAHDCITFWLITPGGEVRLPSATQKPVGYRAEISKPRSRLTSSMNCKLSPLSPRPQWLYL